jgi:hypothetical protein
VRVDAGNVFSGPWAFFKGAIMILYRHNNIEQYGIDKLFLCFVVCSPLSTLTLITLNAKNGKIAGKTSKSLFFKENPSE